VFKHLASIAAFCLASGIAAAAPVTDQNAVVLGGTGITAGACAPMGPGTVNGCAGIYNNGQAVAGGLPVPNAPLLGGNGTSLVTITPGAGVSIAGGVLNVASNVINVVDVGAKCDGSTSDTTAIQSALTSGAAKARVYVPPGVVCMVGTLSLPSHTYLVIDGTLKLIAATNGDMLVGAADSTNLVVEGAGTLDGNATAQTGGFSGGFGNIGTLTYFWWSGLTSTDFRNTPFGPTNTTHAWVNNAVFSNSGNSVGFSVNSSDCWANNITVSGINDEGYAFYGGTNHCGISNSTITDNMAAGVSVLNDAGQPSASHDIIISNNQLTGNGFSGVDIANGIGASAAHYAISITGNRISGNNQGNHAGEGGVNAQNVSVLLVSINQISGDGNGTAGATGVFLASTVSKAQLLGNAIWDEGQGYTLGVGIEDQGATNILLDGNFIYDDQGTQTMAYALNGTAGSGTQILNNWLGSTIGAADNLVPGSDTITVQPQNVSGGAFKIFGNLAVAGAVNVLGSANNVGFGGSSTGPVTITAFGAGPNISINLITAGTGVLEVNGASGVNCSANTVSLTTLTITAGLVTHC